MCRKIKQNIDINMDNIVTNTPGYVGADLNSLIDEALISSLDRRLLAQINSETVENKEFVTSLIEWIKTKLMAIQSNEKGDEKSNDQTLIEVNQSDFDVMFNDISLWLFKFNNLFYFYCLDSY